MNIDKELDKILNKHRRETWSTGWNNDATDEAKSALKKLIDEARVGGQLAAFKAVKTRANSITLLIPFDNGSVKELFEEIDDNIQIRENQLKEGKEIFGAN